MKHIICCRESPKVLVSDPWRVVRDTLPQEPGAGSLLLPFTLWKQQRLADSGVWLTPDDALEPDIAALLQLPLIALDFPRFRDDQGYRMAYCLRSQMGYRGELRAIGAVQCDQLFYLQRCGFDSFEMRAEQDLAQALKELNGERIRYRGAIDDPVHRFGDRVPDNGDNPQRKP